MISKLDSLFGYFSYVTAIRNSLSDIEIGAFYNGLGSGHRALKAFRLPGYYQRKWRQAGIIHDLCYLLGGTAQQRGFADLIFLGFAVVATPTPCSIRTAYVSYRAIRAAGHITWEFRQKPRTYYEAIVIIKNLLDEKNQANGR